MIRDSVIELLKGISGKEDSSITDSSTLGEDLGLDSLDMIQLGLDLETRFGITVPDDSLPEDPTVGNVVEFVTGNIGGISYAD